MNQKWSRTEKPVQFLQSLFLYGSLISWLLVPSSLSAQGMVNQVMAKQGWQKNSITSAAIQGIINSYLEDKRLIGQAKFQFDRRYPGQMRLDIDLDQVKASSGFNLNQSWDSGSYILSPAKARDIRSWLRWWPEYLYIAQSTGIGYREVGQIKEQVGPDESGKIPTPRKFQMLEVIDKLDVSKEPGMKGSENRRMNYFIDQETMLPARVEWLEPDDPATTFDDFTATWILVELEFSDWQQVNGIYWPFTIKHSWGGRVDTVLQLTDIKINQSLDAQIFSQP